MLADAVGKSDLSGDALLSLRHSSAEFNRFASRGFIQAAPLSFRLDCHDGIDKQEDVPARRLTSNGCNRSAAFLRSWFPNEFLHQVSMR